MKLLALLLSLCMLIPLASCAADPADPVDPADTADSGSAPDSVGETTPAETTADPLNDNLPEEPFDGEEIIVWIDGSRWIGFAEEDMVEGDILDEAIVARNRTVEDRFDVAFAFDFVPGFAYRDQGVFRQSLLGGDEYDLVEGVTLYQCPLAIYGCYTDLALNEYVDFEKPWWLAYANESLMIGEHMYMGSGYWDFNTIPRTKAIYFNANMAADYEIGNLFDLVESGDWTWDKMTELGEKVCEDVNQDGIFDTNDQYALAGRWDYWMNLPSTTGYQFIAKGDDGVLHVTGLTDDLLSIHEMVYPYITNNTNYRSSYTYGVDPRYNAEKDAATKQMFVNDQILFLNEMLSATGTALFRDFGAYGLLPFPKLLPDQENYGSAVSAHACAISITTGDYRISSIVLEALQAESYKQLRPVYFETALSKKFLNDPQSVKVLDILFSSIICDWAYCYANAGIGLDLSKSFATQANLSSWFASNTEAVETRLAQFLSQVESIPPYEPQ